MNSPKIEFQKDLSQISLFKDETLTIFVQRRERLEPTTSSCQIEIRQSKDGKIEIFTDNKDIEIKSFNEWYSV
jgi:hypothetical protein